MHKNKLCSLCRSEKCPVDKESKSIKAVNLCDRAFSKHGFYTVSCERALSQKGWVFFGQHKPVEKNKNGNH